MGKLVGGSVALILALAGTGATQAAQEPVVSVQSAPGFTGHDELGSARAVAGGAFWVPGAISNSGFFIGETGVVVIDAQISIAAATALLAEIAKLTDKPVTTVILTHGDPDHVNGLPAFPRGIELRAQTQIGDGDRASTRMIAGREMLILEGVTVQLIHPAAAHTDADLVVYLPEQRLVYAGDLLAPAIGLYPGIHLDKGGSSMGWISAIEILLGLDADVFVSGHGEPLTRAEVQERLAIARERRTEIQAFVDQGKTLPEIKTELGDQPLNGLASRFPTFIETTYRELTTR